MHNFQELWASIVERYEFFWLKYVASELITGAMIPAPSRCTFRMLTLVHKGAKLQTLCQWIQSFTGRKVSSRHTSCLLCFCVAFVHSIVRRYLPLCDNTALTARNVTFGCKCQTYRRIVSMRYTGMTKLGTSWGPG